MIELLIKQHRALEILLVVIIVFGYLALENLGREEIPYFEFPGVYISAQLPGASPEEIDRKVARPIHKALNNIPGVKEVSSEAKENAVFVSVNYRDEESDTPALDRQIAQRLNQISDLPSELKGPYVSPNIDRYWPDMIILLEGGNEFERQKILLELKNKLRVLPELDDLVVLGERDRRVEVQVDASAARRSGLRLDAIADAIEGALTDNAAGRLEGAMDVHLLRSQANPATPEELANIALETAGGVRLLGAVATITDTLEPELVRVKHNNKGAEYIKIHHRPGSNVARLSQRVQDLIRASNRDFLSAGQPFKLVLLYDSSDEVSSNLNDLASAILVGMALVVLVLWLFLGARNAFYAAIGIPFAYFATFLAMGWLGLSLNTLTLFGLILVCGMIVDDAIVVIENVARHRQQGADSLQAINRGVSEVAGSVLASTLTTIAAFFPLLFMTGEAGKIMSSIPKVAILVLIASLVECFVLLPVHLYSSKRPAGQCALLSKAMDQAACWFAKLSGTAIAYSGWCLGGLLALVALTIIIATKTLEFTEFEFEGELRTLRFSLEFPNNTDLVTVDTLLREVHKDLERFRPGVKEVVTIAGWRDFDFNRENESSLATIELTFSDEINQGKSVRDLVDEIESDIRKLPGLQRLQKSVLSMSPPQGVPVAIHLYGNDFQNLQRAVKTLRSYLADIPSVTDISNPMADGIREEVFTIDSAKAQHFGLQAAEISRLLHIAVTGREVGKMDVGDEVIPIFVKAVDGNRRAASALTHLSLPDGRILPLSHLGQFESRPAPASITRLQNKRYVSITAQIDETIMSVYQTQHQIAQTLTSVSLPPAISLEQRGEFEDVQESINTMFRSGLMALGLSYLILSILFRSYWQPLIVILMIPLAFMGVVWGFALTGQSVDVLSFAGIVGLIGIIVNDALVWMNFYNLGKGGGMAPREAAVHAVNLRFRPIALTTLTTIIGLLPALISGSAGLATPMAKTFVYGLSTTAILLLIFLPIFCVIADEQWARFSARELKAKSLYAMIFYRLKDCSRDT